MCACVCANEWVGGNARNSRPRFQGEGRIKCGEDRMEGGGSVCGSDIDAEACGGAIGAGGIRRRPQRTKERPRTTGGVGQLQVCGWGKRRVRTSRALNSTVPMLLDHSALAHRRSRIASTTGSVRSRERQAMMTRAPSRASSYAVSTPIPLLAPVTIATFP